MMDWRKTKAPSKFQKMCIGKPNIILKALRGKPVTEMKLKSAILLRIARWL